MLWPLLSTKDETLVALLGCSKSVRITRLFRPCLLLYLVEREKRRQRLTRAARVRSAMRDDEYRAHTIVYHTHPPCVCLLFPTPSHKERHTQQTFVLRPTSPLDRMRLFAFLMMLTWRMHAHYRARSSLAAWHTTGQTQS